VPLDDGNPEACAAKSVAAVQPAMLAPTTATS
jgi:hypothetical protein